MSDGKTEETHEPELWRHAGADRSEAPGEVCGTCSRRADMWIPASWCAIARPKLDRPRP